MTSRIVVGAFWRCRCVTSNACARSGADDDTCPGSQRVTCPWMRSSEMSCVRSAAPLKGWSSGAGDAGSNWSVRSRIVLRLQVRADMIRKASGTRRIERALQDVLRAKQRETHKEQCREEQEGDARRASTTLPGIVFGGGQRRRRRTRGRRRFGHSFHSSRCDLLRPLWASETSRSLSYTAYSTSNALSGRIARVIGAISAISLRASISGRQKRSASQSGAILPMERARRG